LSRLFLTAALAAGVSLTAEDSRNMILAASRMGAVEFIDPATLETVSRIRLLLPPDSVGINGVAASIDGSTLYVDGPFPATPDGCCALYSIDLATLDAKLAATIPGSPSRLGFVVSGGLMYRTAALTAAGTLQDWSENLFYPSPNGRWLLGIRNFRGPALNVYDVAGGRISRRLDPQGLKGECGVTGTWSGERFYFYAYNHEGAARLWTVSPDEWELGDGVPVMAPAGCSAPHLDSIVVSAGRLYAYEAFGYKIDRRNACTDELPGGAWTIDPATGQLSGQVAPGLHFSMLIPDHGGSDLYGVSAESSTWSEPAKLVRIDGRDGRVIQSRPLGSGYWRITTAPLRIVPQGDVRLDTFAPAELQR
jgi:hypothetical protein